MGSWIGFVRGLAGSIIVLFFSLAVSSVAVASSFPHQDEHLLHIDIQKHHTIGVLSFRGGPAALRRWSETARYLSNAIVGHHFRIKPLSHRGIQEELATGSIDFLLTNPGHYIELASEHALEPLVTLINRRNGRKTSEFGSVIFVRASNDQIQSIADLSGRSLAAVNPVAFGGYRIGKQVLIEHGIDPEIDLHELRFTGFPMRQILDAVLEGQVDAGIFRSDLLEGMAARGWLDLEQIRLLNPQQKDEYPFLLSSPLYPEWPFLATHAVDDVLQEKVASVLQSIKADDPVALTGGYSGWNKAADYGAVERLYQSLDVFDEDESFEEVVAVLVVLLILPLFYVLSRLSSRLWLLRVGGALTILLLVLLAFYYYQKQQLETVKTGLDARMEVAVQTLTDSVSSIVRDAYRSVGALVRQEIALYHQRPTDEQSLDRLISSLEQRLDHDQVTWLAVAITDVFGDIERLHLKGGVEDNTPGYLCRNNLRFYQHNEPTPSVSAVAVHRARSGEGRHFDVLVPMNILGEQRMVLITIDISEVLSIVIQQAQNAGQPLVIARRDTGAVEISSIGVKEDPRQFTAVLQPYTEESYRFTRLIPATGWFVYGLQDPRILESVRWKIWGPFLVGYGLFALVILYYLYYTYRMESRLKGAVRRSDLAQRRMESLFSSMNEGLLVVDNSGRVVRANRRLLGLVGMSEQELRGQPFKSLFQQESETTNEDFQLIQQRLQILIDESDLDLLKFCADAPIAMLLVNASGNVVAASKVLLSDYGWKAENLVGGKLTELLPQRVRGVHDQWVAQYLSSPAPREMGGDGLRLGIMDRSGREIEVQVGLIPVMISDEQHVLAILNGRLEYDHWDIFLLSSIGREFDRMGSGDLLRGQRRLILAGGEKTLPVQLSSSLLDQLEDDKPESIDGAVIVIRDLTDLRAVREATRAKDDFLASMSHELRTPLTSIIGNSELLSEMEVSPDQRGLVEAIQSAGRTQLALVNDILDHWCPNVTGQKLI